MGMILRTKHFLAAIVALLLAGLAAAAGYAWYRVEHLSIPISNAVAALSTVLPIFTAFTVYYLSQHRMTDEGFLTSFGLLIVDAVMVTLSATYLSPDTENCQWTKTWTGLFKGRSLAIKQIQDTFQCCGFRSTRDMPFPFPVGKGANPALCEITYPDRKGHPCLPDWSKEERRSIIIFLVVAASSAFIKIATLALLKFQRSSHQILNQPWFQFPEPVASTAYEHGDADRTNGRTAGRTAGRNGSRPVDYGTLENERARLLEDAEHADNLEDEEEPRWGETGVLQPSSQTYAH